MNTETKELLEMAAKAMELAVQYWEYGKLKIMRSNDEIEWVDEWNPLNSADDLIEMECQMLVCVAMDDDGVGAITPLNIESDALEKFSNHPTRRAARAMASLRVVAEIGRRMGEEE